MASQGRAVVLIDNGYLSKILKDEFGEPRLDYLKFSEEVCKGWYRLRTYIYDALPYQSDPPTPEQKALFAGKERFFNALKKLPSFEVRFGRLRPRGHGIFIQKGVDALLDIDLVWLAAKAQIQRAFLIAGDADYCSAVQVAKDEGVSVKLYYSGGTQVQDGRSYRKYANELWDVCDEREVIDKKLIDKCKF